MVQKTYFGEYLMKKLVLILTALWLSAAAAFAYPTIGAEDVIWSKYYDVDQFKCHPSGQTIVIATKDQGLLEIDATTGNFIRKFEPDSTLPISKYYFDFDFSSNGKYLFGIDGRKQCFVWDCNSGELMKTIHTTGIFLKNIPGTERFLVINYSWLPKVWIYDAEEDSIIRAENILPDWGLKKAIAVSPDAQYFAVSYFRRDNGTKTFEVSLFMI